MDRLDSVALQIHLESLETRPICLQTLDRGVGPLLQIDCRLYRPILQPPEILDPLGQDALRLGHRLSDFSGVLDQTAA